MRIPSSENQQEPLGSQDKKNGKNTPFSGSLLSSIDAAILWPLWLENAVFFHQKKLASLTGNTGEALQCVRLHQKAPERVCRQFKLTTKNIFISGTLRRCLRWDLVLETESKSSSSYGNDICQAAYIQALKSIAHIEKPIDHGKSFAQNVHVENPFKKKR